MFTFRVSFRSFFVFLHILSNVVDVSFCVNLHVDNILVGCVCICKRRLGVYVCVCL